MFPHYTFFTVEIHMSRSLPDFDVLEQTRMRKIKQDVRMRAINRLRRLNMAMSQYSRKIVTQFVDDETISVERFRLLVILAGFPVNALFSHEDGKAHPCITKEDIAERMNRVDGMGEIDGPGEADKHAGGGTTSESVLKWLDGAFSTTKSGFKTLFTEPYTNLRTELNEKHPEWKVEENAGITLNVLKMLTGIFLVFLVNRILLGGPSKLIYYILFGPSSGKRPDALSHDDLRTLPLRPGWEMRETTRGHVYFFQKATKRVDRRVPVLSDEVPYNWVEWILPKTNESEYENTQTGRVLRGSDAYVAIQNDMEHGELKRGWTESINTKNEHRWLPPAHSPYKSHSYTGRPLEKPHLEKQYGVVAWEFWDSKRRNFEPGTLQYQFIRDADTDLYFYSLQDVERECRRRARGETTPARRPYRPTATPSSRSPTFSDDRNMADIQHEIDRLFSFRNMFAFRVGLTMLAVGTSAAMVLPFALRKRAKYIDNRMFATVLSVSDKPVMVAPDIPVPTQTAYQHTLANIDYELHLKFLECGDDLAVLRDRLLRMRKPREAFHQRSLLPYHLIRTDGHIRESPNEIALAIAHHWQWGNVLGVIMTRTRSAFRHAFTKRPAKTQSKRIASSASSSSSSRSTSSSSSSSKSSSSSSRRAHSHKVSSRVSSHRSSLRRRTIGGRCYNRFTVRR